MTLRVLVLLALVLSACRGGSDEVAVATPEPVVEAATATVEVVQEPTATAVPVVPPVSDQDRINAVTATFDVAIRVGDAPEGTIAYDVLDSSVSDDGAVTLNICAWDGETVFDEVRESLWRTDVASDGTITATHVTTPLTSGECLNTHLIDTALAAATEYDQYWNDAVANPDGFDPEAAARLAGVDYVTLLQSVIDRLIQDDLTSDRLRVTGSFVETAVTDLLWARSTRSSVQVLELVVCRDMDPLRGLYRDGVLIDDERSPDSPGLHSIDVFQLQPMALGEHGWVTTGRKSINWSDCLSVEWPEAANDWINNGIEFRVLEQ